MENIKVFNSVELELCSKKHRKVKVVCEYGKYNNKYWCFVISICGTNVSVPIYYDLEFNKKLKKPFDCKTFEDVKKYFLTLFDNWVNYGDIVLKGDKYYVNG